MANWKLKVSFKDFWGEYKKGNLSVQEISKKVVEKLNDLLKPLSIKMDGGEEETLREIIMEFVDIAQTPELTIDDFDNVLEKLYDWGDTELKPYGLFPPNKLCWISTII